jgi:hypothetical protein
VSSHFYDHLCAATTVFLDAQNISDDHPAVEFLNDLEATTYYVDENSSGYILVRWIIYSILRWVNMLNCRPLVKVGASYVLWCFLTQLASLWLSPLTRLI